MLQANGQIHQLAMIWHGTSPANCSAHPCKSTTPSSAWSPSACSHTPRGSLPAVAAAAPWEAQRWFCQGSPAGCRPGTTRWVSELHPAAPWAAAGGHCRTGRVLAAATAPWKPPWSGQCCLDFHSSRGGPRCCCWAQTSSDASQGSSRRGWASAVLLILRRLLAGEWESGSGKDPGAPGCWGWKVQLFPKRRGCFGVSGGSQSPGPPPVGWVWQRGGRERSSQWCYHSRCRHQDSCGPSPAAPAEPTPDQTGLHGEQEEQNVITPLNSNVQQFTKYIRFAFYKYNTLIVIILWSEHWHPYI